MRTKPRLANQAARLAYLRRQSGLTLREVAEKVGISHSRIDAYETDPAIRIKMDKLRALADVYDTTIEYIETGVESKLQLVADSQSELDRAPNDAHAVGLLSDIPVIELGRVSFSARASFNYAQLQRFMTSDIFDKVLFRLPPGRTAEDYADALVFDIEGDSMEPSLRDGQQVIAWPVPEAKWEHLHNTICVVDYDDTVTVKAIFKNDLFAKDGLVLHATGGRGGEFTVGRSLIHSIWEVREFYGVVPVRLIP
ncbi:XRE family transcriptional regulator [Microvirga sp. STS02]|uniref:XRE family transcriptional regulator n=1 Tax=Hymenobacter negativus TaxID=2795026 RepID=UPI0018DBB6F6|nr:MULTISPECIES: XRE family transcriptional regulator [Bacteria]MBH8569387.1 XRE family transcriptional regulator [Hymenobacter negativus]MBR7209122.1 XRE family transcriptional regulator [Microvirga sp. STS02]